MDDSSVIVLKVGTSTLMDGQRVNLRNIAALVEAAATIRRLGRRVVIVTSGAVGFGCVKLGLCSRPTSLSLKQACAAAGQSQLVRLYEDLFTTVNLKVAQILLCRSDFSNKDRFANFIAAMSELLALGVVPIINENDTVSVSEIRFGDNDTLSALVAVSLAADKLVLLTDVDCLYTADPRTDPHAKEMPEISPSELHALRVGEEVGGTKWGTGGMATKIVAARTAVCAGIETLLVNGTNPERVVEYLMSGKLKGSVFKTDSGKVCMSTMTDKRRWILGLPVKGVVHVDEGAALAIGKKKSLFAAGVIKVQGRFLPGESVKLYRGDTEIARAIVTLNSDDLDKIKGRSSDEYQDILGYSGEPEIAFRTDIILSGQLA